MLSLTFIEQPRRSQREGETGQILSLPLFLGLRLENKRKKMDWGSGTRSTLGTGDGNQRLMIRGAKGRETNAKEVWVKAARWCDRGRERQSRCKEIAMAEGACLSPQLFMCLSITDLCVCLCLHPQLCHFRNAFHILCRYQQEFTGLL